MKGLEFLDVMTPIEKFWVFGTLAMLLTRKGEILLNMKFLAFPAILKLFREIFKEMGLKNVNKLMKEWEWLFYAAFLTYMSLGFNKSKKETVSSEDDQVSALKSLIAKCENKARENRKLSEAEFDDGSGTGILFTGRSRARSLSGDWV